MDTNSKRKPADPETERRKSLIRDYILKLGYVPMTRGRARSPGPKPPDERVETRPRTSLSLEAERHLADAFVRNGCIRFADAARRESESGRKYKKGYEVRLVLRNWDEVDQIRHWLIEVGLKPGKPYLKRTSIVQPVYGKQAADFFVEVRLQWRPERGEHR